MHSRLVSVATQLDQAAAESVKIQVEAEIQTEVEIEKRGQETVRMLLWRIGQKV